MSALPRTGPDDGAAVEIDARPEQPPASTPLKVDGRVLLVSLAARLDSEWAAPYCADLASYLVGHGAHVRVLAAQPLTPAAPLPGPAGALGPDTVAEAEVQRIPGTPVRVLGRPGHIAAQAMAVRRSAADFAPDVIVACLPSALGGALGALAARRLGVPCVAVAHDLATSPSSPTLAARGRASTRTLVRSHLERVTFRGSLHVTVPAAAYVPLVRRAAPHTVVDVVPNWPRGVSSATARTRAVPADEVSRSATRRQLGWAERFVVAHVGTIGPREGLEDLAPALHHLAVTHPDILVSFVGDGPRRAALAEATAGLPSVEIRDPLPPGEQSVLLQAADLLLVHERSTGTGPGRPSAPVSYFAAGRPVIAVVPAGSPTALELEHSRAGITVPPLDASTFAARLSALRDDPDARERMGNAGLVHARDVLPAARSLERLAVIVRGALDLRRDSRGATEGPNR